MIITKQHHPQIWPIVEFTRKHHHIGQKSKEHFISFHFISWHISYTCQSPLSRTCWTASMNTQPSSYQSLHDLHKAQKKKTTFKKNGFIMFHSFTTSDPGCDTFREEPIACISCLHEANLLMAPLNDLRKKLFIYLVCFLACLSVWLVSLFVHLLSCSICF